LLKLTEEILISALRDHPSLWEFDSWAREIVGLPKSSSPPAAGLDPLVEMYVLGSMRELMEEGWAHPGTYVVLNAVEVDRAAVEFELVWPLVEFVPWEIDPEEALGRIQSEWRALSVELFSDNVCRFSATEVGHEIGRDLLKSRAEQ
jgi:hypothetical protein